MIKTWQQTLQCELLLASACKVEIENDGDANEKIYMIMMMTVVIMR